MWKIILIVILTSCEFTSNAPTMPRKLEVWNGAPEEIGICRLDSLQVANKMTTQKARFFSRTNVKDIDIKGFICIPAEDSRFKKFGCLTWVDITMFQTHIENLIKSCERWK